MSKKILEVYYQLISEGQFFRNYDYADSPSGPGTSVYRDVTDGKVKSVDEWRKKKQKRRKKNLKRILDSRKDR